MEQAEERGGGFAMLLARTALALLRGAAALLLLAPVLLLAWFLVG